MAAEGLELIRGGCGRDSAVAANAGVRRLARRFRPTEWYPAGMRFHQQRLAIRPLRRNRLLSGARWQGLGPTEAADLVGFAEEAPAIGRRLGLARPDECLVVIAELWPSCD